MADELLRSRRFLGAFFVAAAVLLCLSIIPVWQAMYPNEHDPKNIHYVLWKHGLNGHINLDNAVAGMTHDTWAVNRLKGMSTDELKRRFGYIRSVEEATPYLRRCYTLPHTSAELGVPAHGKSVVFLQDGAWMVILHDRRAVDLVLCKGY